MERGEFACVCVCMYVCVCVCFFVCVCMCVCVCTRTDKSFVMDILCSVPEECMYVCICMYMYVYVCICMYIQHAGSRTHDSAGAVCYELMSLYMQGVEPTTVSVLLQSIESNE